MTQMPVRIVFLDFDGVLITEVSAFRRDGPGHGCEKGAIDALNHLVAETSARVVVSSTWRLEYSLVELREMLESWGVQAEIIGVTPEAESRHEEIRAWLDDNVMTAPVKSFVILDDLAEMGPLESRLIQTDAQIGLSMQDAKKACELLAR